MLVHITQCKIAFPLFICTECVHLNPCTLYDNIAHAFDIALGHRLNMFLMDSVHQTIKLQSLLYLMLYYQKETGNGMMTPLMCT